MHGRNLLALLLGALLAGTHSGALRAQPDEGLARRSHRLLDDADASTSIANRLQFARDTADTRNLIRKLLASESPELNELQKLMMANPGLKQRAEELLRSNPALRQDLIKSL